MAKINKIKKDIRLSAITKANPLDLPLEQDAQDTYLEWLWLNIKKPFCENYEIEKQNCCKAFDYASASHKVFSTVRSTIYILRIT